MYLRLVLIVFLFQAEDGIRVAHWLLEFRRVVFRSGIQFRDFTTLIHNGWGLRTAIDRMATASAPYQPTLVAGIEARGFIFGAGIAHQLGLGFVPVRKSKKLPGAVIGIDYEMEDRKCVV